MECHFCTQGEKTQDWYTNLCPAHRAEYCANKRKVRLEKKRALIKEARKGDAAHKLLAECIEFGHSYMPMEYGREICRRCGFIIASRKRLSEGLREYHNRQISNATQAWKNFQKLQGFYMRAPRIFEHVSYSAKVANILYYLRYNLKYTDAMILKVSGMTPSVLNAYIVKYPAVYRNGEIVAL